MTHLDGQALLDRLDLIVDAHSGILRGLQLLELPPGYDGVMHAFAAIAGRRSALQPTAYRGSDELGELAGFGIALDETTARIRALCEAIERYCSLIHPVDGMIAGTSRDLGSAALDPRRLPQCSVRERAGADPAHRLRLPDVDAPEQWVPGYSMTRDEAVLVPATAVYVGLPQPLSDHLSFPESTGFAAGTDFRSAALAGLCEVIERDSIALWWLHQLPMPRISSGSHLGAPLESILSGLARVGVHTHLLDLTSDLGVPVIGLIQVSPDVRPHVLVGAACRPDALAAAVRVVEEAGCLRVSLASSRRIPYEELVDAGPRQPVDFGLRYAHDPDPQRFAFALQATSVQDSLPAPITGPDPLSSIVRRLAELKMEVIVVDVTAPEIRDLGLLVVRVLVPELMRISFAHAIRYLGQPRLYTAPLRMGYGLRTEDMITHDPIPFA